MFSLHIAQKKSVHVVCVFKVARWFHDKSDTQGGLCQIKHSEVYAPVTTAIKIVVRQAKIAMRVSEWHPGVLP